MQGLGGQWEAAAGRNGATWQPMWHYLATPPRETINTQARARNEFYRLNNHADNNPVPDASCARCLEMPLCQGMPRNAPV